VKQYVGSATMSVIVVRGSEVDLVVVVLVEVRQCVLAISSLQVERGRAEAESMLARDVLRTVDSDVSIARVDFLVVRRQNRKPRRNIGNILGNSASRLCESCVDSSYVSRPDDKCSCPASESRFVKRFAAFL
jgi:hypothetical protein